MEAYTDIEQSKKLAEFLPLESADMYFEPSAGFCTEPSEVKVGDIKYAHPRSVPCWSLAALLELLPKKYNDDTVYIPLVGRYYEGNKFICGYFGDGLLDWTFGETPVDACYKMIVKLNELKLL